LVKKRSDREVLELLANSEVPADLSLKVFYKQVRNQVKLIQQQTLAGQPQPKPGPIAESFARAFGFEHWATLRYLLARRDKMRRRPSTVEIDPETLSLPQQAYLKNLRYRKAEVVQISLQGSLARITHRTPAGNLITYEVTAKGDSRYVPLSEESVP